MLVYPTGKTAEDYEPNEIPDYLNDPYYRTDHTTAEVGAFLTRVNKCIRAGEFIVLDDEEGSRKKNADFLSVYGLYTKEEQKRLLLSIDIGASATPSRLQTAPSSTSSVHAGSYTKRQSAHATSQFTLSTIAHRRNTQGTLSFRCTNWKHPSN